MRTAGQRIRGMIRESGREILDDRAHVALAGPPDRTTFVVVRNPFEWYLSRWAFLSQRDIGGARRAMINAVPFGEHMAMLRAAYEQRRPVESPHSTGYFRETLTGWHSWVCGNQLVPDGVAVVRFDRLADELPPVVAGPLAVSAAWVRERLASVVNSSIHGDWRGAYARADADWVRWVDREYFKAFGFGTEA